MWLAKCFITLGVTFGYIGLAQALSTEGDGGGGGGNPTDNCLNETNASFYATPASLERPGTATLRWSVNTSPSCRGLISGVRVNGSLHDGLTGSSDVQVSWTSKFPAWIAFKNGTSKPLDPVTVTVEHPVPIVKLSPGSQVTAEDIAQFDERWMKDVDREERLNGSYGYRDFLEDRQVHVAWGMFEDASAMVRMYELTQDTKYLDHLRAINEIAFTSETTAIPGTRPTLRIRIIPKARTRDA